VSRAEERLATVLHKAKQGKAKFIVCPICGWTSFNLNDVANRYCGHCHRWHAVGCFSRN
jgi:4-hydroxy-3-methylbut-2-en-1-yl diphosphate synthase IspG/GcpE